MQCVNCDFENIPGVHQCARCQSVLELDGVSVDPPRAGPYRLASRARRVINPIRQGITWMPHPHTLPAVRIPWQPVAWSLVPGLGHIRCHDARLGLFLLGSWLACFPLILLTLGLALNLACIVLAVLIHSLAILTFLGVHLTRSVSASRTLCGLVLFAGLWVLVYQPTGGLLRHFYVPLSVSGMASNPVLDNGDALLCQGVWLRPAAFRRGDLVTYRLPHPLAAGKSAADSLGLDRILAVPGDVVRVEGDRLLINGQLAGPSCRPIGPLPAGRYEATVAPGQYMIVSSALGAAELGLAVPARQLMGLALVSQDDVLGRVVLRVNPLWRFGRVN